MSSDSGQAVLVIDDSNRAALSTEEVVATERIFVIGALGYGGNLLDIDSFCGVKVLNIEPCCADYDYYWDHEEANLPCSSNPLPGVSRPWLYPGTAPKHVDKDYVSFCLLREGN